MAETREVAGSHDDGGKLILRVALGVLILFHGIAKLTGGGGFAFVTSMVVKAGLPSAFAYLVYVGEVLAPVLIILGLWTRLGGLLLAINMVVAVALVLTSKLFALAPSGGYALELEAIYFFAAVAVCLLGAGRYSLGGTDGRWN